MRKFSGGSMDGKVRGLLKHDNLKLFKVMVHTTDGDMIETYKLAKDGVRYFVSSEPNKIPQVVAVGVPT